MPAKKVKAVSLPQIRKMCKGAPKKDVQGLCDYLQELRQNIENEQAKVRRRDRNLEEIRRDAAKSLDKKDLKIADLEGEFKSLEVSNHNLKIKLKNSLAREQANFASKQEVENQFNRFKRNTTSFKAAFWISFIVNVVIIIKNFV